MGDGEVVMSHTSWLGQIVTIDPQRLRVLRLMKQGDDMMVGACYSVTCALYNK